MNILYSVFIKDDKKNMDETIYPEFVVRETEAYQKQALSQAVETLDQKTKAYALSKPMKVIKYITFYLWLIIIAGLVSSLGDGTSIQEGYENAPYLYYALPIVFFVWLSIFFYELIQSKKAVDDGALMNQNKVSSDMMEKVYQDLNVPGSAKKMDVLGFRYSMRDDKVKVLSKGLITYLNLEKRVYIENGTLYMADLDKLMAIPIDAIDYVQLMKKRVVVPSWNKEIPHNRKPYKSYKIRTNDFGQFFIHYGIMHINLDGRKYDLYLPDYEIDELKRMIDLRVEKY